MGKQNGDLFVGAGFEVSMSREKAIEQKIRGFGSLVERLQECNRRVRRMCVTGKPPKMSIPASWNDDDVFISTTIKDAIAELSKIETS